ncbi:MAG: MFS transporter, partial [Oscillospiraceae bacterium]|nr:MFS transporter [Oscillospiraceae bacterium]
MLKKMSNKTKIWVATVFCFMFMFAESLVGSIFSMLQPYIIKHYGLTLTESTILSLPGQIGHMLIMFIVMMLNNRIDKVKLLFILPCMLGLGCLGISTAPALGVLIVLLFMNTMGTGFTDNTCTAYVSSLWGNKRGQMIGAMFILFVVGSSIAPTINTIVLEKLQWGWNGSYRIVGVVCLTFAILYLIVMTLMKRPELPSLGGAGADGKQATERVGILSMLNNRNMKALFLSSITQSFYMYFSSHLPIYFDFTNPEIYTAAT